MAKLNPTKRTLTLKIVYYGPGLSGKTTNLLSLHARYPAAARGKLARLDTETERTMFFAYFPAALGKLGRYQLSVNFFTVPGQAFYNQTRRIVTEGVDGVVFVADSHPTREEANQIALSNLHDNLATQRVTLEDLPMVLQWNKRDLADAIPVKVLERQLNPRQQPSFEAIAREGQGVWETQKQILSDVLVDVRAKQGVAAR